MREELLGKTELRFDYFGNSQSIQVAKDIKIRRFPVRKVCSGEKTNGVTG